MTVKAKTEFMFKLAQKMGISAGEISHSTNRYNQHSSYFVLFKMEGRRYIRTEVRVSDHSCNLAFRPSTTMIPESSTPIEMYEALLNFLQSAEAHFAQFN